MQISSSPRRVAKFDQSLSGYYSPAVKYARRFTVKNENNKTHRLRTRLVRSGRDKRIVGPFINPPVFHASTVLFDKVDDMLQQKQPYEYGRWGTPTSDALEAALNDLEGADGTALCPSGLSAATVALLACVSAGDRVLLTDNIYGPVRRFADGMLKRLGVETVYYDHAIGPGLEALFTPKTTVVYCESPGSLTFEMQDLPAIAAVAHRHGATVLFDNTWATPLYFRALDHGADVSIMAGTKYIGGHSDTMIGTAAARGETWKKLRDTRRALGIHLAPDDMYLALRGMRTLAVRLEQHQKSALAVARWLQSRPEVARVLYPALESDPGHALWKRDMTGASGLFGVVMKGWSDEQAKRFADSLSLFGIGASWGGFESLVTVPSLKAIRTATSWQAEGPLVRLHIGLEDPADLIEDLEAGFAAAAARG
jgi:cystathionine beta-lyase